VSSLHRALDGAAADRPGAPPRRHRRRRRTIPLARRELPGHQDDSDRAAPQSKLAKHANRMRHGRGRSPYGTSRLHRAGRRVGCAPKQRALGDHPLSPRAQGQPRSNRGRPMVRYMLSLAVATVITASCAAPDTESGEPLTADAPPLEEQSCIRLCRGLGAPCSVSSCASGLCIAALGGGYTCCTGCVALDGSCTYGGDDLLCGHGGVECQNCGTGTCVNGTCQ
jgi:hypothetical protein